MTARAAWCQNEWKKEKGLTSYGFGATHTLLCIQVAEALETVRVIFPGGEALA